MLLTLPIFLPIIKGLGYDPVWFGILFNLNMQIAYLSPPFGGAPFFLKSVAPPDVTMEEIFSSCWPWMGLQVIALALVVSLSPTSRSGCRGWRTEARPRASGLTPPGG